MIMVHISNASLSNYHIFHLKQIPKALQFDKIQIKIQFNKIQIQMQTEIEKYKEKMFESPMGVILRLEVLPPVSP